MDNEKLDKGSKQVILNDDLLILIPDGMIYSTDKLKLSSQNILVVIKPEHDLQMDNDEASGYDFDAPYSAPECFTIMKPFDLKERIGFQRDLTAEKIRLIFKKTAEQTLGGTVILFEENDNILIYYNRTFANNIGYYIFTTRYMYSGQIIINDTDETNTDASGIIKQWFSSIKKYEGEDMDSCQNKETQQENSNCEQSSEVGPPLYHAFLTPAYQDGKYEAVGRLKIAVPDHFTTLASVKEDPAYTRFVEQYLFIAIPDDYPGGFASYMDAPFSIGCRSFGIQQNPKWAELWSETGEAAGRRKDEFCKVAQTSLEKSGRGGFPLHYEHLMDRLDVVYAQNGESDDPAAYWRSYHVMFVEYTTIYNFTVFFNGINDKRAIEASVDEWVKRTQLAAGPEADNTKIPGLEVILKKYLSDDGNLDAVKVSWLFSKDVLFTADGDVQFDGVRHQMSGLQLNIEMREEFPEIFNSPEFIGQQTMRLAQFLEQDDNLFIPKDLFHPNLLTVTRNQNITGITVLEICASHMLFIKEKEKDVYEVVADKDFLLGIPEGYRFLAEFIKDLRAYNGRKGAFKATISAARNLTSPIKPINQPVNGAAAFSSVKNISVADGEAPFAGVCETVRKQKGASSKTVNAELEAELDDDIIDGIKKYTQEALAEYKKIPYALKAGPSFDDMQTTDEVLDSVLNKMEDLPFEIYSNNMYGTIKVGYANFILWLESGEFPDITYQMQVPYEDNQMGDIGFNPNQIPDNLIAAVEQLTEEKIYHNILMRAVAVQNRGNILVSNTSPKGAFCELLRQHDEIEISGTQFEGRSARIENVQIGDKLELVRESNNAYDKNAVDVRNAAGSLGHLPAYIVEKLAPLMDAGMVTCTATVSNVLPLSKRGSRAKKAILKVRLQCTFIQKNQKNRSGNPTESQLPQNAVVTNIGPALSEEERQWLIKQKAQKDRDAQGRALARDIRSQSNNNYKKFIRRRNEQHSIMLDKQYDFLPAEELQEDLSAFQNIIDEYGGAEESLIRDGLTKLTKMKSILSAEVIIDIIEAIYSVFFSANVAPTLFTYPKACLYTYHWTIDISTIKKFLLNARKNLKRVDSQEKAEREKEEAELKEAKKYGISVSELHIRHKYMEAKEGMSKARTSKDYTALAEDFAALNGYKDSKKLMEECRKKASSREYAERQAKDFLQEWQLACEKVKAERINRQDALQKELNAVYNEKLVAWEKEQADKLSQCAKKRDDLSKKAQQIQKELNSAGFLSFLKKQKLKAELVQVRIDQSNAKKEESDTIALYNKEKKDLQDAHAKDLSALQQRIERELPMPFKNIKVSAAEDIVKELEKSSR